MSSFFPCHPKTLFLHTWLIIWFDDLSNHLDSIENGQLDVNQIADLEMEWKASERNNYS
ncbi:hypothetical protein LINPERPRIM_LOCUS35775 [Linum perenne]